jgi:type IX secretion system PorP/SprF family membrane protein
MFKKLIYVFILVLININVFSQDPTFSQFYANPLYLAPSFAGAIEDSRLAFNYRNQWPSISNIYNTYSISYDRAFHSINSGMGILSTHDIAGSGNLSTTNIGFLYSYDIRLSDKWHVRPGVHFKFRYLGLDINKLIFGSQIPGNTPTPYPPVFEPVADLDFASSAIAFNDNIWIGLTVDHLLRPSQSFYGNYSRLPIKYNVFGGFKIIPDTRLISRYYDNISVAFNFQVQDKFYQSDVGFYYNKSIFYAGIWYRGIPLVSSNSYNDAIIGLFGVKMDYWQVGYSYDVTISSIKYSTGGAHELSFIYRFKLDLTNNRKKMRALPCPEF